MLFKLTGVLLPLLLVLPAWGEVRTWTDTQGRSMRAEFVRELNGQVTVLRAGKLITLDIDKLSEQDRQYLLDLAAGVTPAAEPDDVPAAAPTSPPDTNPFSPAEPATAPTPTPRPQGEPEPDSEPVAEPAVPGRPGIPSRPGAASVPADDPFALPGETRANPGGMSNGNRRASKPAATKRQEDDVNRLWTDIQGQSTTAKFVRMFGRKVILSRSSKVLTVPYDNLSAGDQEYLKELLTERGLEAQIPPPLPSNDGSLGPSLAGGAPAFDPGEARQRNLDDLNQRAEEARQRAEDARNRASEQAEQSRQRFAEQAAETERQRAEARDQYLAEQQAASQRREEERAAREAERVARDEQQRAEREARIASLPVGKCSSCLHDITRDESQGTNCPHCNAVWTYKEDQFGRKTFTGAVGSNAIAKGVGVLVVIGVVLIGGFGIFIAIIVAVVRSIANSGKVNRRREMY